MAALMVLEDGRYILQLRDGEPDIWFPAHWGCFGGGIDSGENPEEAIVRELEEELEFIGPVVMLFETLQLEDRKIFSESRLNAITSRYKFHTSR